ncbi:MAG TPA: UdgX family uracil-DNA binding protein [Acetobacteraceae bacterium]|nr:UdgX family uracil-DNA binding protein [Acetobacteraceae bacterium]
MRFPVAMRRIGLRSETDWDGWRTATRSLVLAGVPPDDIRWQVRAKSPDPHPEPAGSFGISRALVALAAQAIQARDPTRFDLLYRLVWRAHQGAPVADERSDPDFRRAHGLALAVRAEQHRMRTQLRYLRVEAAAPRFIGWYAPAHFVIESNAQLLAKRFPELLVSILAPDGSAHWDADGLRFGPGVEPASVADDAGLAAYWHAYGAELLATSRPGTSIHPAEPLGDDPWPPDRPSIGPVVMPAGTDEGIETAVHEAADCRRCHLWEPATQTVFGEGPAGARVMFIGEQPGDQEDVIGRPFVGPAGLMLDRAMAEAGIDRRAAYVTNAVKHFKFTPRGKRRIHQTPEAPEIQACRFWLDVERVRLAPSLIVLLGATAARAVLGRPVTIGRDRGRPIRLSDSKTAFVTVHPSFLLRVPDEAAKHREYRAFVEDLRKVAKLAGGSG